MRKDGNGLIKYHKRAMFLLQSDIFSDVKEKPNDSNDFKNTCKFINRCAELEKKKGNCSKNHFHVSGAGAPTKEKRKRRIISFLKNIWTVRHFFEKDMVST